MVVNQKTVVVKFHLLDMVMKMEQLLHVLGIDILKFMMMIEM